MAIFQKTEAIIPSQENKKKRISFIGQPNTGKSTFFNRITNAGASVANWSISRICRFTRNLLS